MLFYTSLVEVRVNNFSQKALNFFIIYGKLNRHQRKKKKENSTESIRLVYEKKVAADDADDVA